MGLGTVSNNNGTYLSIAGGFIWNRKADQEDPNYATQTFVKADKSEGVRAGARYADITGVVTGVMFKTHDEYGENINVTFEAGEEKYIISISTNNRYSQDMMKMLLKTDLSKEVFMKPYDFIGKDKKRAMGLSFRQNGEKINLRCDDAPQKDAEWFKTSNKKDIKRFFEDLNDWFVAEIEEKVCSQFTDKPVEEKPKSGLGTSSDAVSEPADVVEEQVTKPVEKVKKETPKVTPLKMKKALNEYIAENYEGKSLPKLSKVDLIKWYELSVEMEELPFEEEMPNAEVSKGDLDSQLNSLLG